MKIIMMRPTYKPELSGGTHLASDLVEDFIKAGHTVELITPISERYVKEVREENDECKIHRIRSKFQKRNVLSRIFRYIDVSLQMRKIAKRIPDADLIMTHSMPPLLGPLGAKLGKRKKIPVLYWEQDVVSESLVSTEIFGKSNLKQKLLYFFAQRLEKSTEKNSTHIVTISKQFEKMHLNRGVSPEKLSVIYNWIDTAQIYPVPREQNPLFDELQIPRDKFIISYCGNIGIPQNVEIMIDAAEKLQDREDILFVLIGSGSREKKIQAYVQEKHLKNLLAFPLQPLEKSHLVYSLGDVGLVIGKSGTSRNGFPSKTWSIMAAEQAMIACFDTDSELASFRQRRKLRTLRRTGFRRKVGGSGLASCIRSATNRTNGKKCPQLRFKTFQPFLRYVFHHPDRRGINVISYNGKFYRNIFPFRSFSAPLGKEFERGVFSVQKKES